MKKKLQRMNDFHRRVKFFRVNSLTLQDGHRERHKLVNLSGNRVRLHSSSSSNPNRHMKFRELATVRIENAKVYKLQNAGGVRARRSEGFYGSGFHIQEIKCERKNDEHRPRIGET